MANLNLFRKIRDAHQANFESAYALIEVILREPDSVESRAALLAALSDLQDKFNAVDRLNSEIEELLTENDDEIIVAEVGLRGRTGNKPNQARVLVEEKISSTESDAQERASLVLSSHSADESRRPPLSTELSVALMAPACGFAGVQRRHPCMAGVVESFRCCYSFTCIGQSRFQICPTENQAGWCS